MRQLRRLAVLAATAVLAAACTSASTGGNASNTNSTNTQIGVSNSTSPTTPTATLKFDDLGGNSTIVQVYPGAADTSEDKVSNGTFHSGDTAAIVCKTMGREVRSQKPERSRHSRIWYKIQKGGQVYYATAVYGDVSGGPVTWCPGM